MCQAGALPLSSLAEFTAVHSVKLTASVHMFKAPVSPPNCMFSELFVVVFTIALNPGYFVPPDKCKGSMWVGLQ